MSKADIHSQHRQRLRKQFIDSGLDTMSDYQALELLLFYAIPRRDTNPISHALMDEFGSLSGVLSADIDMLTRVDGVGEIAASLIKLVPELTRRYLIDEVNNNTILQSIDQTVKYLQGLYVGRSDEILYMLCMDSRYRLKRTVLLHEGTLDKVAIYPRKIMEEIIKCNASNILLSHNHPCGSAKPSINDLDVTKSILAALQPMGIKLLDHIIIAKDGYYSFVEDDVYRRNVELPPLLHAAEKE